MEEKREFSPMRGQFPDPNKIECRNCIYRDKTLLTFFNPPKPVGVTKAFCTAYPDPPGKPSEVLFNNGHCPFYQEE